MTNKPPNSNNVYSTISYPVDLKLAKRLLKEEFPDAKVWIYTSGYNGAKTLHVDSETADFEGYPEFDDGPDYLFNGTLCRRLCRGSCKGHFHVPTFRDAGLQLSIEAYGSDNELICRLPGNADASE
ncbi:MAG: hypothetical protein MPJ50_18475 [Pirellulales bacterium]|nr:hypothetical protein [Pirellulales bacterium]